MPRTSPGLALLLILIMSGLLPYSIFGDRFLTAVSVPKGVLVPLLMPPVLVLLANATVRAAVRARFPTAWVRWLAWPLFAFTMASVLFISCQGWIAGASRLLANEHSTVELEVLSVRRSESRRRTCLQSAEVKYLQIRSFVCADPFLAQGEIIAGKSLLATGVISPLGLHIESLRVP